MRLFTVTTTMLGDTGRNVTYAFDAGDDVATVDEFFAKLQRDGAVSGHRYRVAVLKEDRGTRIRGRLRDRRPVLVTVAGVAAVTPFGTLENYIVE